MRILGFEKDSWQNHNAQAPKLRQQIFTTFRWPRRDGRDYTVGEPLQIVIKPRSPKRRPVGIALVMNVEKLNSRNIELPGLPCITDDMARQDGFEWATELRMYLRQSRPGELPEYCNRYTLTWLARVQHVMSGPYGNAREYHIDVEGTTVYFYRDQTLVSWIDFSKGVRHGADREQD